VEELKHKSSRNVLLPLLFLMELAIVQVRAQLVLLVPKRLLNGSTLLVEEAEEAAAILLIFKTRQLPNTKFVVAPLKRSTTVG
jgi:hypothetical protein